MGLFSFFKKDEPKVSSIPGTLTGIVLLKNADSLNINDVVKDLQNEWQLDVKNPKTGEHGSIMIFEGHQVIDIDDYRIIIGVKSIPFLGDEIRAVNKAWKYNAEKIDEHSGHVTVSLANGGKDPVKENMIFTKVIAAIIANSQSLWFCMSSRLILLEADTYLKVAKSSSEKSLPLRLWVYFGNGIGTGEGKNIRSIYTKGLENFGKKEMEFIDYKESYEAIIDIMFDIVHHVLLSNVTFNHGDTIKMPSERKVRITESIGFFVKNRTLKIDFQ